jgi:multidrug efflux system membrane fusion protein
MKSTYITAIGIAVVLALWFASGQLTTDADSATDTAASAVADIPIRRVRTRLSQAESRYVQIVARGKTEAKRMVAVKAETSGRVVGIPV